MPKRSYSQNELECPPNKATSFNQENPLKDGFTFYSTDSNQFSREMADGKLTLLQQW